MRKLLRRFWKSLHQPVSPQSAASGSPVIRKGPVQVSVGLDFGTHGTKVAFMQFGTSRLVRTITFSHGLDGWPDFVYPAVGIIQDRGLVWGTEAAKVLEQRPWNCGIRRLKAVLAATNDHKYADDKLIAEYEHELDTSGVDSQVWRPEHVAAAALAIQMVEARARIGSLYTGRRVEPQFTIPVPIDHVQNSALLTVYKRIAFAAQRLLTEEGSLRHGPQDLVPAASEMYARTSPEEVPELRVFTRPEAVAQMSSYTTSLAKSSGVHGVIDIGAGTTDVSIFNLRQNDDPTYWYSAKAIPLATSLVHRRVAESQEGTPDLSESGVVEACAMSPQVVEEVLGQIRKEANKAWTGAYNHLRKQTEWEGCPIFLCGGGAQLPMASEVFRRCWIPTWSEHELRALPVPRDFRGNGAPFERMAVAYGLSLPFPEQGDNVLPNDAPDHTPVRRHKPYYDDNSAELIPRAGWV